MAKKPFNRDDCLPELPEPRIRIFLAEEDPPPKKPTGHSVSQEEEETLWNPNRSGE
ncbi:MAG: hypothetical protein Q7R86_00015 [bacterium]|nr:hypothetical protein [bacterium]